MSRQVSLCALVTICLFAHSLQAADRILDRSLHHLRIEGPREWTEFPETPEAEEWDVEFEATRNATEYALRLRQQDFKQFWTVSLNDKPLGRLYRDENDIVAYFAVPPGTLRDGKNVLNIAQSGRKSSDDVRVGEIVLIDKPLQNALSGAELEVSVVDEQTKQPIPARITILNEDGALMTIGTASNDQLAIRPGAVYASNGTARLKLPPGSYKVYAGRGFEWGIDSAEVECAAGTRMLVDLAIRREVPTPGYVACDTHIHTLTHSGHGDASIEERIVTLAAEGIEFSIATDHNIHINYEEISKRLNVRQYFTPVIGNEVTTPVGHFNIFPVRDGAEIPNYKSKDWDEIFADIYGTPNVRVAILNHARDTHGGYRPFDPGHHIAVTGENLDGWNLQANAMEIINSGATQSDPFELFHDWLGLLNRGLQITPVGSSDSHDVARHFVGQGRTYIRTDDSDVAHIDVDKTVENFVAGKVLVSYGLLTEIAVSDQYGPGELAHAAKSYEVSVTVKGPSWVTAEKVELFANGTKIREAEISPNEGAKAGIKWEGTWMLESLMQDVHLVALAYGPGVTELYWPMAKAYQPDTPEWRPYVWSSTGPVWLDADGNGKKTSPRDNAITLVAKAGGDLGQLLSVLEPYDEAIAAQSAELWRAAGHNVLSGEVTTALKQAAPHVQRGFQSYVTAWRDSQIARSKQP